MGQMSLPLGKHKPRKITFASRKHGIAVGVTTEPVGLKVMPPLKSWHRVVPPWCGEYPPEWLNQRPARFTPPPQPSKPSVSGWGSPGARQRVLASASVAPPWRGESSFD